MKNRWESMTLGDVVTFQRGLTYSKKDEVDFSSNIVLRANNIDLKTNRLDFTELKYIKDDIVISEEKKVSEGSLIICTASGSKSHLGKVALIDDSYDYAFGGFMGQLKPNSNIDSKYLFYLLISDGYKAFINKRSDGVNINNLRFNDLSSFPVLLPPLPEQKWIVKVLDKFFEKTAKAKENAEKNLQNSRELFESYLQSVFTNPGDEWEEKKLGEIIKLEYGKPLPNSKRKSDGVYPVYGANGEKDRSNEYYYDKYSIIVGRKGSAGEINLTEERFWPLDVTYFVTFDLKKHDLYFIYYILNHLKLPKLAKGVKPGINRNEVYSIDLHIPPLSEQRRIVVRLNALSAETKKLEAIYQQKLNDLEELKKSILQKAFKGELVEV